MYSNELKGLIEASHLVFRENQKEDFIKELPLVTDYCSKIANLPKVVSESEFLLNFFRSNKNKSENNLYDEDKNQNTLIKDSNNNNNKKSDINEIGDKQKEISNKKDETLVKNEVEKIELKDEKASINKSNNLEIIKSDKKDNSLIIEEEKLNNNSKQVSKNHNDKKNETDTESSSSNKLKKVASSASKNIIKYKIYLFYLLNFF